MHTDTEILEVARSYYTQLYNQQSVDDAEVDSYFDTIIPENRLSENLQKCCEGLVKPGECLNAMTKMKNNKSPGLDGISVEFYRSFWHLVGDLLTEVFNESFRWFTTRVTKNVCVFTNIKKR